MGAAATQLREQAARWRELARKHPGPSAQSFLQLAKQYEADADALDAKEPPKG